MNRENGSSILSALARTALALVLVFGRSPATQRN
jgi:hypothetical protein